MITVDVREIRNHNVDSLTIQIPGSRIQCGKLVEECKVMLNIDDSKEYTLKQNDVFIHPAEMIMDGEELVLSVIQREQE